MEKIERFWRSQNANEKKELAESVETSVNYLSQIFHGHRKAGAAFALRLSDNTPLAPRDFRPDIWRE